MLRKHAITTGLLTFGLLLFAFISTGQSEPAKDNPAKAVKETQTWTDTFHVDPGELVSTGRNPYFILEPGYVLMYKIGNDELIITVLDETKKVDGVETRVIEEKESKNGKVIEISRNFFAISKRTNCVYYFGEEVDLYENGKLTGHEGAWLSGVKGAKFGLFMPGTPLIGARFYNEVAPEAAMDRTEILSLSETVDTPAGKFKDCLKVEETTPLEPGNKEFKYYARGIGLVQDDKLELIKYGFLNKKK